jgi:hypothetical protein
VTSQRIAALLAAALIAVALVESGLGLYGPRSVASDADWAAAAAHVRAQLQPDDLIVFAPAWIDPTGRHHLGDRMPVEMVARADTDRYARIWELSVRGARAEDTAGLAAVETRAFGRVTVRRYDKPAMKVLRDLTSAFPEARVTLQPRNAPADPRRRAAPDGAEEGSDAPETPCGVDGKARRCGPARVEPRVLEIDYRPRRGVLAPVVAGQRLIISYEDVPAGKLVGHVGLHDYYARKNGDGVVSFRVIAGPSRRAAPDGVKEGSADGQNAVTLPVRNPPLKATVDEAWHRFELELGPGRTHTVRVEIESDQPAQRLVGFHAEVRAP